MTSVDQDLLTLVLGPGEGDTPAQRARHSAQRFIRGLDELWVDDDPQAKGRRFSAIEALDAYGFEKLAEAALDGSAILMESPEAAGRVLHERRSQLALHVRNVAAKTQLSPEVIEAMEASRRRPIREYERVARALGLDERMISYSSEPQGNNAIAVRLRSLHDARTALNNSVVLALTEAAWVAMTQVRLEAALPRPAVTPLVVEKHADYGWPQRPAHSVGRQLARALRERLALGDAPVPSMRDLVERQLQIPVIQAQLGDQVAGATLEVSGCRVIILNVGGRSLDPLSRRTTLAHELCHLLFDPHQELHNLRVDEYAEFDQQPEEITDRVEQRANAFAVEFLAPQPVALQRFEEGGDDPLAAVIEHFGISYTAARYQIWNAARRRFPLEGLRTQTRHREPVWEAREAYTTVYHPLRVLVDHPARAGRFSAVVLRAATAGLISWDTAGEWLFSEEEELQRASPFVFELYPDMKP